MANIQDKITKQFPEATFEDGEILLVNIPDAKWHDLAKFLKEDADLHFDHLITIASMSWLEALVLGVVQGLTELWSRCRGAKRLCPGD